MAPKAVDARRRFNRDRSLSRAWPAPTVSGASTLIDRRDGSCRRGPWPRKRWMHVEALHLEPNAFAGMARSYKGNPSNKNRPSYRNRAASRDNRASAMPTFSRLCAVSTR